MDEKSDLQLRAESLQRKRLIISYMNTPEAATTIEEFKKEANKFSDNYLATLQHLLETGQPSLAEALLYGEVEDLKARVAEIEQRDYRPTPQSFGRKD